MEALGGLQVRHRLHRGDLPGAGRRDLHHFPRKRRRARCISRQACRITRFLNRRRHEKEAHDHRGRQGIPLPPHHGRHAPLQAGDRAGGDADRAGRPLRACHVPLVLHPLLLQARGHGLPPFPHGLRRVRSSLQGLRRRAGTRRAPQLGEDAPFGGGLHTAARPQAHQPATTHPPAMGQARAERENRNTLRRASPAETERENGKETRGLINTRICLRNRGRLPPPLPFFAFMPESIIYKPEHWDNRNPHTSSNKQDPLIYDSYNTN